MDFRYASARGLTLHPLTEWTAPPVHRERIFFATEQGHPSDSSIGLTYAAKYFHIRLRVV